MAINAGLRTLLVSWLSSHSIPGPGRLSLLCITLAAGLTSCSHRDMAETAMPFDGVWSNSSLGYDVELQGPFGLAVRSRDESVHDGDPIFRMTGCEETRFTGRQWMADGKWHTVSGELKQDGKLHMSDGITHWTLERAGNGQ
jgi:hypothetical protein